MSKQLLILLRVSVLLILITISDIGIDTVIDIDTMRRHWEEYKPIDSYLCILYYLNPIISLYFKGYGIFKDI